MSTEILPDDAALRHDRRTRILAEMEAAGVDALVLGREANARFVSGVPRLWLSGTRPFGAGCVIVRATGALHLLSPWDEGVPADIPRSNLYGYTFNPANQLAALRAIEGSQQFERVATDAMGPGASDMLLAAFPAATIVDGEQVLARARRIKSAAEIDAIAAATRVAAEGVAAAAAAVAPGITPRRLTGVCMEAMGRDGLTMPSTQDAAWITSRTAPWERSTRDTTVVDGDLVALEGGVMLDGYNGVKGTTVAVGEVSAAATEVLRQAERLWQRMAAACRPGAAAAELLRAYDLEGVTPPPMPVAYGLGLGFDAPVVTAVLPHLAATERIDVGMVIALTSYVWSEGVGAAVLQAPVVVTATGAEPLV